MPRATDPAPAPRDSTQRLELRLPDVSGANGFLDELAAFLGIVPTNETRREAGRAGRQVVVPGPRPDGAMPEMALGFADRPAPTLFRVDGAGEGTPLPFVFTAAGAPEPATPLAAIAARLQGFVPVVDHLGINFPADSFPAADWLAALRTLATSCLVLPFDPAAQIAFALPATPDEREHGLADPTRARKPKLELVRDASIHRPYLSLALDTPFDMAELVDRFPDPTGFFRPGNEAFFRSVRIGSPLLGLDLVFDFNTKETAELEISHLLVEAGHVLPDRDDGASVH